MGKFKVCEDALKTGNTKNTQPDHSQGAVIGQWQ